MFNIKDRLLLDFEFDDSNVCNFIIRKKISVKTESIYDVI